MLKGTEKCPNVKNNWLLNVKIYCFPLGLVIFGTVKTLQTKVCF